jgi:hypothetical protein
MIGVFLTESGLGLVVLGILVVLTFIVTLITLVVSRKYLKTRISLSLEIERDPNPHFNEGDKNHGR